jgi:predicted cobalt transporter CbtA
MKQWLNSKLGGTPSQVLTVALILTAIFLVIIAFTAQPWMKLITLVWVVAP